MKSCIWVLSVFAILRVNAFDRSVWPKFGEVPPINKTWTSAVQNGQNILLGSNINACKDSKAWALTFDDGPSKSFIWI